MLKSMRVAAQSWVAKALFAILLGSFAIWGIGPIFQGGGRIQTAATVGHVKITTTEADQALRARVRQFEQQFGVPFNSQMIAQLGLKRQTIEQAVLQSLYDQAAAKLGLRLGDKTVRQTIAAQPGLRNEQGQFDPTRFQMMLQQLGMNEATYISSLKGDIARLMLMGAVRGAISPSSVLYNNMYAWKHEQRSIQSVQIKAAAMTGIATPSDADLETYLKEHGDKFMAPEYRAISYLVLDVAKIAAGIEVSDDEARKTYDENPESYSVPESRTILQITTPDKAIAEKVAAETAAGKSLQDAAKAHNLTARPVSDVTRTSIVPQLAEAVFALAQGKASAALQSPMGWHVLEVTAIKAGNTRSFDQAKNEILAGLKLQKGQDALYELTRKLQDAMAGGASLADAAKQIDMNVVTIEATTADGYRPDGSKVQDAPILNRILASAFALPQGQLSQVEDAPEGAFVTVVNSITPAQVKELKDVRADVLKDWMQAKRLEMAQKKAEDQAVALRSSSTSPSLGASRSLDRDGQDRGKLPEAALAKIFSAKTGEVLTVPDDEGVWIIRLTAITPPATVKSDDSELSNQLKEQLSVDILQQYGDALRKDYGVSINEAWINQNSDEAN